MICHQPTRHQFKEFAGEDSLHIAAYFYLFLLPSGRPTYLRSGLYITITLFLAILMTS